MVTQRQSLVVATGRRYPKAARSVQPPPCCCWPRVSHVTLALPATGAGKTGIYLRGGEYSVLVSMQPAQTASPQVPGAYIPAQHRREGSASRGWSSSPGARQLPRPTAGKSHRAVAADPGDLGRLGATGIRGFGMTAPFKSLATHLPGSKPSRNLKRSCSVVITGSLTENVDLKGS